MQQNIKLFFSLIAYLFLWINDLHRIYVQCCYKGTQYIQLRIAIAMFYFPNGLFSDTSLLRKLRLCHSPTLSIFINAFT